jgi:hypothetical protein
VAGLAAGPLGCGGGGGSGTGPTPAGIQVGGQYSTAVTLTEDTCGGTSVQSLPTTVAQTAGQTRFTLTHGGTTYSGTLATDGSFRTDSLTVTDSAGAALTIAIEGRFATQGFDAVVNVAVDRPAADCRYLAHWVGTKQGAPNVIP